jgi:hypothetical protein
MSVRGIVRLAILTFTFVAAASPSAFAQVAEKIGVTMGYPSMIGVLIPMNDQISIRPEISFGGGSTESSSNSGFGLGVGALWYIRGDDLVRTYVTPNLGFVKNGLNAKSGSGLSGDVHSTVTTFSGSLGAEYRAHPNFGLFAELGLAITHTTTDTSPEGSKRSANAWGTRTAIGAIVRF